MTSSPWLPSRVGEAEQALLEDRVRAVPQREREAQLLAVVADPREPVLAPAVGARARLVVGEVAPGVAAVAVVLADRAPLALAQVRAPRLHGTPVRSASSRACSWVLVWVLISMAAIPMRWIFPGAAAAASPRTGDIHPEFVNILLPDHAVRRRSRYPAAVAVNRRRPRRFGAYRPKLTHSLPITAAAPVCDRC